MSDTLATAAAMAVADVASRLGAALRRTPSAVTMPCPACRAERRHPSRRDARGAVGASHAKPTSWRCHACQAAGDALDFAAYALAGARFRDLASSRRREVLTWFEREGLGGSWAPQAPRPAEPPRYPPVEEVVALWAACGDVGRDRGVAEYLRFRGIDQDRVADLDLARALPGNCPLPLWAGGEREHLGTVVHWSWAESRHRLLVPLYDATGAMRSLIARSIDRAPRLKSLPPYGYQRGGLVMADRLGRGMLEHGRAPRWWAAEPFALTVAEGEKDYCAVASTTTHGAVLGIVSGSWTPAIAARIPAGAHVTIATDDDDAGDRYAAVIEATLEGRCAWERRR